MKYIWIVLLAGLVLGCQEKKKGPFRYFTNYQRTFNDMNPRHLQAAKEWGIAPITSKEDMEKKLGEMEEIESCRFYEVDESGHPVAEIEKIRNQKMPEKMQNRFKKFQMREISPEEIMRLDTLFENQGLDWRNYDTHPEFLKKLGARLSDSVNVQRDESYLHDAFSYRQLMVEEMCRLSRVGHLRHNFAPFRMSDEDLNLEIRFRPALIKSKLKAQAYKNVYEYRLDVNRLELIRKIVEMRQVVKINNQVVRALQKADRLAFETEKKDKIQKLRQMPPKTPANYETLMQKFVGGSAKAH